MPNLDHQIPLVSTLNKSKDRQETGRQGVGRREAGRREVGRQEVVDRSAELSAEFHILKSTSKFQYIYYIFLTKALLFCWLLA